MPAVKLVPCLEQLREEFDGVAPQRDTASDGWIGDPAHQLSVSDHNNDETGRVPVYDADRNPEVHGLDVDADLNNGVDMERYVQHILARCRSGAERRLRYVIYYDRIWEASNGWKKRAYTGPNKHREHAHFSASYETKHEASTASWTLQEVPVSLTPQDKTWLSEEINKAAERAAELVWRRKLNIETRPGQKTNLQEAGSILRYTSSEHHKAIDGNTRIEQAIAEIKASLPNGVAIKDVDK